MYRFSPVWDQKGLISFSCVLLHEKEKAVTYIGKIWREQTSYETYKQKRGWY